MNLRRRKSSCPNIENRRASVAASKGVNLDLYIEEDELLLGPNGTVGGGPRHRTPSPTNLSHHSSPDTNRTSTTNIEELAEEVLVLRVLSARTRYKFGGLQIHIKSPIFSVDKLFNVEFDQDSQVSLIKSQQSASKSSSQGSIDPRLNGAKSATIVVSPDMEDFDPNRPHSNLSTITADLTLYEEPTRSPKKPLHVSAHSLLSKTPEIEPKRVMHPPLQTATSSASEHSSNSVKFDSVKVYANLDRSSLIESYDLETKDSLRGSKNCKSKIASMRRHTHYKCYVPSSVAQAAASRMSDEDLSDGRRGSGHNIRRFMTKKVNDTWRNIKEFKQTFTIFK